MINVGLVGAGRWGKKYINTIQRISGIRLSDLVTKQEKTDLLVNRDCSIHKNYESINNNKRIDGVILTSSADVQPVIARNYVEMGLPLIIQKPIALNLVEANKLKDKIENNNALVLVDHTYLFHPAFEKLKDLININNGIINIQSTGIGWGPFRRNCDPLWDWGPHDISMCLALLQEFPLSIEIENYESKLINGITGKIINIRLDFPSGTVAHLKFGNLSKKRQRVFMVKSRNKIFIFDDYANNKLCVISDLKEENIIIENDLPLDKLIKLFRNRLNGKIDERFGIELAIQVIKVLNKIDIILSKTNDQFKQNMEIN